MEQATNVAQRAYDDEQQRTTSVEGKAGMLVATLGIAASVILGASGLMLNNLDKIHLVAAWLLVLLLVPYAAAVVFLGLSLRDGIAAVRVGFVARPDPGEIVRLQATDAETRARSYLADLLIAYERNRRANNRKVAALREGQWLFLAAAACLLCSAFFVIIFTLAVEFFGPGAVAFAGEPGMPTASAVSGTPSPASHP